MPAAVIAYGAASALGVGEAAFALGPIGAAAPRALSTRAGGKPFGRVNACDAERSRRPGALLELGLRQVTEQLERSRRSFRQQRLGVVIGTSSGGFAALERALAVESADGADPQLWSRAAYFAPLAPALKALRLEPARLTSLYAACASSTLALGLGLRWLELGEVELVIAGGYDAESDWVCAGFDALKATSGGTPRPFRAERDGMALGEGVGLVALALEPRAALGFVSGFGASTDAVHITAPDRTGAGLARAAESALADARIEAAAVDFVSAHGTGTSFNDAAEAAALQRIFAADAAGARARPLHAFKPSIGHTLGAAGVLEALAALSALAQGLVPAAAGEGTPMAELPASLLERNEAAKVEHCLKLSTAFGGANAALVLSRCGSFPQPRVARPVHVVAFGVPCRMLDVARLSGVLVAPLERLPRADGLSELAVAAAAEALRAAEARGFSVAATRTGVVVGSAGASLQVNSEFGQRILARGPEHAEPRRFPGTSPNAAAGQVAIAFGLRGLSHSVGASAAAPLEALEVARDWIAAGDADAMLVVVAEPGGATAERCLGALGLAAPPAAALAVLLSVEPAGRPLDAALLQEAQKRGSTAPGGTFGALSGLALALGLPNPEAFGSVRPPE
jgi:3-oxoacyl-[acyl-carrier-protein] synthase-1/3-oxoacyl-[acyl-carrier-protein] synthase II